MKFNRKTDIPLATDVFSCHIRLLLSKETIKKANIVISFKNDHVELFLKKQSSHFTLSGHYFMPITNIPSNLQLEGNCNNILNLDCLNSKEGKQSKALKAHRHFGHHNIEKLIDPERDSKIEDT